MNQTERERLAKRLSALSLKQARQEMRRLDPAAEMKFWRNTMWDEYHTLFVLPGAGLTITLVERVDLEQTDKREFSGPKGRTRQKTAYRYIEARVDPLDRPVPTE
ncbi:MAG: hypothetical protein JXJ20_11870 [Anaerolineae bacterium]|nr:hypothetical protein [Anaerolineae bacterium]